CSMSAAGNCYDNAVAESFFATLKKELVHGCAFETRSEAYDAISDYIENYYQRETAPLGRRKPVTHQLRAGQFRSACGIVTPTICPGFPGSSSIQHVVWPKTLSDQSDGFSRNGRSVTDALSRAIRKKAAASSPIDAIVCTA